MDAQSGKCGAYVDYKADLYGVCLGKKVVCYPPPGSFFPVGTTKVTCKLKSIRYDAAGNTGDDDYDSHDGVYGGDSDDECSFYVTVRDRQGPDVHCPPDIVKEPDAGKCGAVVWYDVPCADACQGDVDVHCYPPSGSFFPIGETVVKCIAKDKSGNTSYCNFKVTIPDKDVPGIKCPDNIYKDAEYGKCGAVVEYDVHAWSACKPNPDVKCYPPSGSFFPVGETQVKCEVKDSYGKTSYCSFKVIVRDRQAPDIDCPPDVWKKTYECDEYVRVDVGYPTATDNCDAYPKIGPGVRSDGKPLSDPYPIGVTYIRWTAKDKYGNESDCKTKVSVQAGDCQPDQGCTLTQGYWKNHPDAWPVNSLKLGSKTYTKEQLLKILSEPVKGNGLVILARQLIATKLNIANGADDKDIKDKVLAADILIDGKMIPPTGDGYLDPSKTSSVGDMLAMYNEGVIGPGHCQDQDVCVLECPEDIVVDADPYKCGAKVDYYTIISGFCPDTTVTCYPPPGHFFPIGKTKVTCRIEPLNNHLLSGVGSSPAPVLECEFWVTVLDKKDPDIKCPGNIYTEPDYGKCGAVVNYDVKAWDQCTNYVDVDCWPKPGSFFPIGETEVKCVARDAAGNTAYCKFKVIVADKQGPDIICSPDIYKDPDYGKCGAVVHYDVPAQDPCSDYCEITCNPPSGSFFPIGTTTVKCVAKDRWGNVSYCSFKVIIRDKHGPQLDCPDDIYKDADYGKCGAVVYYDVPVKDPCGDVCQVEACPPSGSFFPIGETVVKVVARDQSGNTAYCTFKVHVRDKHAPHLDCPDNIYKDAEYGKCGAKVFYDVKGYDQCGGFCDITCDPPSGYFFPVGETVVKCVGRDHSGNTSYCTFKVIVRDRQAPDLDCPPDVWKKTNGCDEYVRIDLGYPTVEDNCDPDPKIWPGMRSDGKSLNDPYPIGVTYVTWKAEDKYGNKCQCTTKVTVQAGECQPDLGCTYTQGYWKNHPDAWPVSSLKLGTKTYTKEQLLEILSEPVKGNGLVSLARQLIATKLNIANGADDKDIKDKVLAADILIDGKMIPPTGDGYLHPSKTSSVADMLAMYNEGVFGPGHCDDQQDVCVLECPEDIEVDADPGQCGAVVDYTAVISGFCPDTTVTCTPPPGTLFPIGETEVVCRIEPMNYPSSELERSPKPVVVCKFKVIVRDNQSPDLDCPDNIYQDADPGKCGAIVDYSVPASDACTSDGMDIECHPKPGSFFPIGETVVKCVAKDRWGNKTECTFKVIIRDIQPPVLDCPEKIVRNADPGKCGAKVYYDVSTFDPCTSSARVVCYPESGSFFPVGETLVKCVSKDASGNTTECTFKVIVIDKDAPELDCPADIYKDADPGKCGTKVYYELPVSDACTSEGMDVKCYPESGSFFPIGETVVKCVAKDRWGNADECTFKVVVRDKDAPQLDCPDNITRDAEPGKCGAVVHYDTPASDTCSGDLDLKCHPASGSFFPIGETVVRCVAKDIWGNKTECTFKVIIRDKQAPVIDCPDDIYKDAEPGKCGARVYYDVSTYDPCTSSAKAVCYPPSGALFPIGTTVVKCVSKDASGNTSECTFKVIIRDKQAPDLDCPDDIYKDAEPGKCGAKVNYDVPASDTCGGALDIKCYPPSGSLFPIGTTVVKCVAKDASGNTSECTFKVIIRDKQAPDLDCPDDIYKDAEPGKCGAVVHYSVPSSDSCGGSPDLKCEPPSGTFFPVGETVVKCVAKDAYGNTNTCTFKVIVRDRTKPDIDCPPDVWKKADGCDQAVYVRLDPPKAYDNCDPHPVISAGERSDGKKLSDPYPIGTTYVSWTATDKSGNKDTCKTKVTVEAGDCDLGGCTYTQGYWKNHPDAWPVDSLKLGNRTYTKAELLLILKEPVRGNRLIQLAHQLIAAKLNVANGADPTVVQDAIKKADEMIGNLVVPPIGQDTLRVKYTAECHILLGRYNEGHIGPGHCDD